MKTPNAGTHEALFVYYMKKITNCFRAIIAIAMMLGVALPTLAHHFEVNGIYYNILDQSVKTVAVTYNGSYFSNSYTGSVTIPSSVTYNGTTYSVTKIDDYAFYYCTGLTEVNIPNSVTSIGYEAFYNCTGLTSVNNIPNSVTEIGSYAFRGTAWYNNQADGIVYINNVLYEYKGTMPEGTSILIKDGTVSISSYAFYGCTGLISVNIPNSVTEIGSYAFYGCTGLTEVNIPNSVTLIGHNAFYNCTGLTSVTIGNSVTEIGSFAFYNCTGLTEVNYNAENCTSMGSSDYPVFRRCSNLKTLNIGNEVKNIPSYAFKYCTGLTSVTIGNSVTSIGSEAFYNCTGLTSVTIGNSVTSIGYEAFYNCTGLTEVNISDLSAWCKIDFNYSANPLYYAKKLKLNGSEIKDLVIPNDITEIKKYAFNDYYGLTSVTIPNSVTKIGGAAFSRCYGLTEVTIGNSVTEIGYSAFYDCSGLTSITIPNSVTEIGSSAFEYCYGLTSVVIGKSVKTIGENAFDLTCLQTMISLNPTPPICVSGTFEDCYATLYVPKDSYAKYFIDDEWGKFYDIEKIETLVSSIKLNNTSIELDKGSTATLSATVSPSNATINDVIWESSNPQVAKVDQSGIVTALSAGTATITATAVDGSEVSTSCKVVVKGVETKITLSQTEVKLPVNDIMTLTYTVTPSNTPVEWSTSNSEVAYLKKNSDGSVIVVGMAEGEAIITATAIATDGTSSSASCKVIVGIDGVEGIEADNNAIEIARYDIHGRLITEPTKGVNIIKYSDGTTRKEIIKK